MSEIVLSGLLLKIASAFAKITCHIHNERALSTVPPQTRRERPFRVSIFCLRFAVDGEM